MVESIQNMFALFPYYKKQGVVWVILNGLGFLVDNKI